MSSPETKSIQEPNDLKTKQEALKTKMDVQRALLTAMVGSNEGDVMHWIETYGEAFGTLWREKLQKDTVPFCELGVRWLSNRNPTDQQELIAQLEKRQQELTLPRAA